MIVADFPWVSLAIALPATSGLMSRGLRDPDRARRLGLMAVGTSLAIGFHILSFLPFDELPKTWLVDPWSFSLIGAPRPVLGVDSLSGPLIPYLCLLALAVLLATPRQFATCRSVGNLLLGLAGTLAVVTSLDLAALTLVWIATLFRPALDVSQSSRSEARTSARVLARYFMGSALAMVAAALAISVTAAGTAAPLHIPDLATHTLPDHFELPVLVLVLVAACLRKGIVPFHSWYPCLFEHVPPGTAGLFVAAHLGAYLIVRLGIPLSPMAATRVLPALAVMAVITAMLGAILSLAQRSPRRTLAYLSLSQSALVMTGLAARSPWGIAGGLIQWMAVGLALTGLSLVLAAAEARIGEVDLRRRAGLASRAPTLSALFLVLGFACVGVPGTLGFVGDDLLVHGLLETYPPLGVGLVLTTALNGWVLLRMHAGLFLGPPIPFPVSDLLPRERLALVGLALALVLGGLVPGPLVAARARSATRLSILEGANAEPAAAHGPSPSAASSPRHH